MLIQVLVMRICLYKSAVWLSSRPKSLSRVHSSSFFEGLGLVSQGLGLGFGRQGLGLGLESKVLVLSRPRPC